MSLHVVSFMGAPVQRVGLCSMGATFTPGVFDYHAFFQAFEITKTDEDTGAPIEARQGTAEYRSAPEIVGQGLQGITYRMRRVSNSLSAPPFVCVKVTTNAPSSEIAGAKLLERAFPNGKSPYVILKVPGQTAPFMTGQHAYALRDGQRKPVVTVTVDGMTQSIEPPKHIMRVYTAMPSFDATVASLIAGEEDVSASQIANLIGQAVSLIAVLQSFGLQYTDISPRNLLISACEPRNQNVVVFLGDVSGVSVVGGPTIDLIVPSYPYPDAYHLGTPSANNTYWQLAVTACALCRVRVDDAERTRVASDWRGRAKQLRQELERAVYAARGREEYEAIIGALFDSAVSTPPPPFAEIAQRFKDIERQLDGGRLPIAAYPYGGAPGPSPGTGTLVQRRKRDDRTPTPTPTPRPIDAETPPPQNTDTPPSQNGERPNPAHAPMFWYVCWPGVYGNACSSFGTPSVRVLGMWLRKIDGASAYQAVAAYGPLPHGSVVVADFLWQATGAPSLANIGYVVRHTDEPETLAKTVGDAYAHRGYASHTSSMLPALVPMRKSIAQYIAMDINAPLVAERGGSKPLAALRQGVDANVHERIDRMLAV